MKFLNFLVLATFLVSEALAVSPREHRGFYGNIGIGHSFNFLDYRVTNEYYGSDPLGTFTFEKDDTFAFGTPVVDLRAGAAVANLLAFYSNLNFNFGRGSVEFLKVCVGYDKCNESYDVDASFYQLSMGFGYTIYPFNPFKAYVPAMEGAFIGAAMAYSITLVKFEDYYITPSMLMKYEVGKDWWITDNLSIGFSIAYGFNIEGLFDKPAEYYYDNDVYKGKTSYKTSQNFIQILFRMTRG